MARVDNLVPSLSMELKMKKRKTLNLGNMYVTRLCTINLYLFDLIDIPRPMGYGLRCWRNMSANFESFGKRPDVCTSQLGLVSSWYVRRVIKDRKNSASISSSCVNYRPERVSSLSVHEIFYVSNKRGSCL